MLIEFTFGNFRSFKDLTTLSMVAARISSKYDELDKENVQFIDPKLSLLKSKAIYGLSKVVFPAPGCPIMSTNRCFCTTSANSR
jgi:hypothetical protein